MVEEETHTQASGPEGSSAGGRRESAYLIVIAGSTTGEMHKLEQDATILGRGDNVDLRLMDDGVSRRHAVLELDGQEVILRDLGSANGTFRNGHRITEPVSLADGDKILMGTTTILKFTYQDELEERFQRNLYESAVRDGLTGLFNRRYFDERLRTDMAFAQRHHTTVALVLVDIDSFKGINDRFGHQGGDQVLRELSQRLQSLVRTEDLVARYGGEEFAIVCSATTEPQAAVLAERLRQAVAEGPFLVEGVPVPVTISLGIAIAPAGQIPNETALVKAADVALYEAKRAGRNRIVAFSHFGSAGYGNVPT